MQALCLAYLVIFLSIFTATHSRELPDSPCPEIFRYRYNGTSRQWYGWGQVKNVTEGEFFNLFARFHVNVPGDLEFTERERLNVTRSGKKLEFFVHFPIQTPLPELELIIFNTDILCMVNPTTGNSKDRKVLSYVGYPDKRLLKTRDTPSVESTDPATNESVLCGTLHPLAGSTGLVAGGETITRGTWPWLVAIYGYFGQSLSFLCGSSIISERLVLTAAHCFFNKNGRRLHVRDLVIILGKYDLKKLDEEGAKIVYPDNLIIHPDYTYHNPDADIAVVVTPEALEYTKFIRPICLWNTSESEDIINRQGTAAGWGMDELGNIISDLPRRVRIPVVANSICRNSSQKYQILLTERTLCVGWRNGTSGVCRGDSGGGLAFEINGRWVLRALVSTSPGDNQGSCNLDEYTIFTDVSKFLDWIKLNDPSIKQNRQISEGIDLRFTEHQGTLSQS